MPTPDEQILNEKQIAEIAAWKTNSYGSMVNLPVAKRDALCATVKQLREYGKFCDDRHAGMAEDLGILRNKLAAVTREHDSLQSQLEQLRAENEGLKRHVADLNHDLDAAVEECNEHHG